MREGKMKGLLTKFQDMHHAEQLMQADGGREGATTEFNDKAKFVQDLPDMDPTYAELKKKYEAAKAYEVDPNAGFFESIGTAANLVKETVLLWRMESIIDKQYTKVKGAKPAVYRRN